MRALVQRVTQASVAIDGETISGIGTGICALVGVTHTDTVATAHKLASKLWGLRIFDDASGRMNLSVGDLGAEVMVVSQFTLYGSTERGRRPSWVAAAPGEVAEPLIEAVCEKLTDLGAPVATGRFGGDMAVSLTNDGPVSLLIEVD